MIWKSLLLNTALACVVSLLVSPLCVAQQGALEALANPAPGTNTISETTMPSQYKEVIRPDLAAKYRYSQDGDFSKASQLPTYEWMPVGVEPRAILVGIHGLTLHGRRYRVLARALAINGV